MRNTWKKLLCGTMTAAMLMGSVLVAHAATPFTDVHGNAWYADHIDYAYNNDLMIGTSAVKFEPDATMTRAMMVKVLHNIAGNPVPSASNPFTDVPSDSWYNDPVVWCYENGVVTGICATRYEPDHPISREQMVAVMYRFAKYNGMDTSERADLSQYNDRNKIDTYALDAFSWAVASGVMEGYDAHTLGPDNRSTRAECAAVLHRYNELLNAAPEPTDPIPTEPEPTEPPVTEHIHTWVHEHTDEVGHWGESKFVCQECGWYCTESQAAEVGLDIGTYYTLYHLDVVENGYLYHSYDDRPDWVVDVPASDTWTCSGCGEVTTSDPAA